MSNLTNGLFSPRAMLGAAIVGLIGAAGMCIIEQIYNDRRRVMLAQDLARLDKQVASMKEELDNLKELQSRYISKQKSANNKRPKHNRKSSNHSNSVEGKIVPVESKKVSAANYASDTDYTEYNSALGTDYDVSSEEFYDLTSESDDESKSKNLKQNGSVEILELKDIATVDELLSNGSVEELTLAFKMLLDLRKSIKVKNNSFDKQLMSDVLWRLGKCCHRKSNVMEQANNKDGKREVIFEGIEYCKEAVDLDPLNPEAHKWYAILIGLRSDYVSTKEKIQDGVIFKEHVEKALELKPDDASLYHLIGRFKFELSTLSWLEKKIASTLFAEVPSFTYADALEEFKKAEGFVEKDWKENRLLIAKCYIGLVNYSSAVRWLDKTVSLPIVTPDDVVIHSEAESLLIKYCSYRSSEDYE